MFRWLCYGNGECCGQVCLIVKPAAAARFAAAILTASKIRISWAQPKRSSAAAHVLLVQFSQRMPMHMITAAVQDRQSVLVCWLCGALRPMRDVRAAVPADGVHAAADVSFSSRRELCFTLEGDIFVRYQSYKVCRSNRVKPLDPQPCCTLI